MKYLGLLFAFVFCNISAIVAESDDTTLNLKAFGASASIQTMTCDATAGSATLMNCSGGDFAVGQTIRLPSVGILPTIARPGTVTAECQARNGAVCTGSVTYSYALAAEQGMPNGTITPVGPIGTVTQAAQTPGPAAPGQTTPNVFTRLSWSAVPSASPLILYKSVNGSPLNFYAVLPYGYTTIDDYGVNWSPQSFTCSDLNVPCAAPPIATPNDVFGRITAINGSSYKIGPETYPPKYAGIYVVQNGTSTNTYPSHPLVTASRVTVYHDDTPAFQAIEHYIYSQSLTDSGHVIIFIPKGDYNVYAADQYGGARVFTLVGMNNVIFEGENWDTKIHQIGDRTDGSFSGFIFSECGYDNLNVPGIHSSARCGKQGAAYNLTDPASLGALSVTLTTPARASSFSPGEYVTIATNATVYPGSDFWELNKIRSTNTTTGQLTL
jgi:hypothetical protein